MSEAKTGQDVLFDALTTKGTAFTNAERRKYGLLGLLPTAEKTLDKPETELDSNRDRTESRTEENPKISLGDHPIVTGHNV